MKKIFNDVLLTALALLITGGLVHAQPIETAVEPAKDTAVVQTAPVETKTEPVKEVEPAKAPEKVVTWQDNPNKCDQNTQYIAKDAPFKCIDKPKETAAAPVRGGISGGGSGDCAAEIAKYDWNQSVALAVARAESGLNPGNLNDNPSTGDYSVGCFQVNIYGANAASRPSEAQLKIASVNVAFAYRLYAGNGHSFIGQWGVCRAKVSCY